MIREFQGDYRWLSNFAPCRIELDGVEYPSVEHAFMSAKSADPAWKQFCAVTGSAALVKKESRRVQLVPGWDWLKLDVMERCLKQKFAQEPYRSLLKQTGSRQLQEGNRWNDRFWGVDLRTGAGENRLGKMIMKIRDRL